ncbi:steroid 17-alpha-hydroxylase/17,20 lyase-like isoform X2 [Haliotis rufescens]|uniref:steroid 17-alpha-hydroxylase/17,20 lyase-like isoform X2 n=1 Tax=Haliotis rufescens TaxID=6454 RepID=UPI00201F7A4E|nr:steroid 17-alpha-hydroxylase/17,20 lyase-like isoform X2 [Haliotis rufescens]
MTLDMEWLQRLPYMEQLLDLIKEWEEWLPSSLAGRAVLVGLGVGITTYLITKKRYKLPPGPRGWPLFGNLLEFRNETIYEKMTEWTAQYGPVVRCNMGPFTLVALNSIDVVMEALVKRQADFAGRPQIYSLQLLSDGGRNIAFGDYSPTWKLHRKLATKALKHYMTGTHLDEGIERSLTKGIELIQEMKGPFNPHHVVSLIVFNIINNICFSVTCDVHDNYFKQMLYFLNSSLDIGNGFLEDVIPPLRLFHTQKLETVIKDSEKLFGNVNEEIDKHRQTMSKDNIRDFCDALLLAQEEARDEEDLKVMSQISDRHITQTLADIFIAGLDTSRYTLLWTLLDLAQHPDIQDKLHTEADRALGARHFPSVSDRSSLPYTDAVLHESMRLHTVVPCGLPHKTLCDTKVGGYDIPKGTTVLINHYALHQDPEQWRDPQVYNPDRFLDHDGKMAAKPESWLPFSAGRRVCLGESVAKPELHLLLAGIMRHFKVSLPPGAKVNLEPRGGSFINVPQDYELSFESRL